MRVAITGAKTKPGKDAAKKVCHLKEREGAKGEDNARSEQRHPRGSLGCTQLCHDIGQAENVDGIW